jgi:hypothetical protein
MQPVTAEEALRGAEGMEGGILHARLGTTIEIQLKRDVDDVQ